MDQGQKKVDQGQKSDTKAPKRWCPLEGTETTKIECYREYCAMWHKTWDQCAFLSIADALAYHVNRLER